MATTPDFSTIVQSLDLLTQVEREQLSSILADKMRAPGTGSFVAPMAAKATSSLTMSDADWDQLAGDPEVQRELREIEQEFSGTLADGLERE